MSVKEKPQNSPETVSKEQDIHKLVLYNDEVNSFDYVIESLIEVCGHDFAQAENCTLIAHYKGKCAVKNGTVDQLVPMKRELDFRDLTVEIN
ncbi:MAG: ATP-dependent Clp protease adaptor ClpS [Bacteroidales bacterium]|jgi:ATP-dependent Clp protease adaptor protein ClpS